MRLADVAAVEVQTTPNAIRHQDLFRRIDVLANPDGSRDLGSVAHDVQDRLDEVDFPLGYHAELLGEYKERQNRAGPAARRSRSSPRSGSSCSSWWSSSASGWRC